MRVTHPVSLRRDGRSVGVDLGQAHQDRVENVIRPKARWRRRVDATVHQDRRVGRRGRAACDRREHPAAVGPIDHIGVFELEPDVAPGPLQARVRRP